MNYSNIFSIAAALMLNQIVYASTPVWTFTPLTPTTITVPTNGTATIQYRVTNQSPHTHLLVMNAITGVTQNTTDSCPNPFQLTSQQSCVLTLDVQGSMLQNNVIGGPVVCNNANPLQCYQPSSTDQLNITLTSASTTYTVGGDLSGLTSSVVLQNNGADNLTLNANGAFTFNTPISVGSTYDVTVLTQPAGQNCTVTNGTGTMGNAAVTNVAVECLTNTAYIANYGDQMVSKCPINSNGQFGACADAGNTGTPFVALIAIALNPQHTNAYVTDVGLNTVLMCPINVNGDFGNCTDMASFQDADVFSTSLTTVVTPSIFSTPYGITLNPSADKAYIANYANDTVVVCEIANDGSFSSCVDSGNSGQAFASPTFLTFNPNGSLLYVSNYADNRVLVCPVNPDGSLGACEDSGNLGLPLNQPMGITLNRNGTDAYIVNQSQAYICPIILPLMRNGSINGHFGFCQDASSVHETFNGASGIALNRNNTLAYITNADNNTVSICPILEDGFFDQCMPSGNVGIEFVGPLGIAIFNEIVIH